jgi:hypothetical protein
MLKERNVNVLLSARSGVPCGVDGRAAAKLTEGPTEGLTAFTGPIGLTATLLAVASMSVELSSANRKLFI